MNSTKHTPGPLHNVTGHRPGPWIRQVLNDESEAYIHDKHCNAIARVYSLSDAALIAAAPAMYEALQDIVEGLTDEITRMVEGSKPDTARLDYLANKAGLALAQAEGGGHE